jgi:hypothetical protein
MAAGPSHVKPGGSRLDLTSWISAARIRVMTRASARDGVLLVALTAAAVLLHGYHFGIEDQTLYLPAVEKHLDPSLFPHDAAFFLTQTRFTWFDDLTAWFVRGTHLPLDVTMFLGHIVTLFLIQVACWRLLRYCFNDRRAEWTGLIMLVVMLPFPVAGTRLGLMEQYFHPRGLAMAIVLFAFLASLEGRLVSVGAIIVATAIHPLTGIWSIAHVAFQARWRRWRPAVLLALTLGLACCEPVAIAPPSSNTGYWREALSPAVFDLRYPIHWPWYEWLGVVGPLAMLAYFARTGRQRGATRFADVNGRLLASGSLGVLVALAVTAVPDRRFPLQPMRELHLVYIIMMVFIGARVEQRFLRGSVWRAFLFLAPLTAAVLMAQRHFPSSPHIEWPGRLPQNSWVEAFEWARQHTTQDALFALDPFYLRRPGSDSHSFRAFAQRSMLAEAVHDLAPAAMSPSLAIRWMEQQRDLAGWSQFGREDFIRLRRTYGVSWVIANQPERQGLDCPYSNDAVAVCRVE